MVITARLYIVVTVREIDDIVDTFNMTPFIICTPIIPEGVIVNIVYRIVTGGNSI